MIWLLRHPLARLAFAALIGCLLCAGLARAAPAINVLVAEPTGIYQEAPPACRRRWTGRTGKSRCPRPTVMQPMAPT